MIQKANLQEDLGSDGTHDEVHYTCPIFAGIFRGDGSGVDYDLNYQHNLKARMQGFDNNVNQPSRESCEAALRNLGEWTHSHEDFYGHAIPIANAGGKAPAAFDAWSKGPVNATPTNRTGFWPSTWDALLGGEHPGMGKEPLGKAEHDLRKKASTSQLTSELAPLLQKWAQTCGCWCTY